MVFDERSPNSMFLQLCDEAASGSDEFGVISNSRTQLAAPNRATSGIDRGCGVDVHVARKVQPRYWYMLYVRSTVDNQRPVQSPFVEPNH
jgi:hypothetical protein